ncbi:hypothetical protein DPMN_152891 [Dreissena polymorpha]|uniref:Uncharacterized protein n=1 Tax=Dreissena polymorpha TaxID=45954 RepID=A0A9D4FIA8_DREPO|nr:hypothetical protein DPMN_152891 [Dreissena polymorpha]
MPTNINHKVSTIKILCANLAAYHTLLQDNALSNGSLENLDWTHGLDWTGLVDWTHGLDCITSL